MSDTYSAVYEAVRSRIPYTDISGAVIQVLQNEDIGFKVTQMLEAIREEQTRPCILLRPEITIDGNQWCASYGNMPQGIQGFGDTPAMAMNEFDKEYYNAKIEIKKGG